MDDEFINQYVQRLLREIDQLNHDRFLKETRIVILESIQEKNKKEMEVLKEETENAYSLREEALGSLEKLTVEHKALEKLRTEDLNSFEELQTKYKNQIADMGNNINTLTNSLSAEKSKNIDLQREISRQSEELNTMFKELSGLRGSESVAVNTANSKKTNKKPVESVENTF